MRREMSQGNTAGAYAGVAQRDDDAASESHSAPDSSDDAGAGEEFAAREAVPIVFGEAVSRYTWNASPRPYSAQRDTLIRRSDSHETRNLLDTFPVPGSSRKNTSKTLNPSSHWRTSDSSVAPLDSCLISPEQSSNPNLAHTSFLRMSKSDSHRSSHPSLLPQPLAAANSQTFRDTQREKMTAYMRQRAQEDEQFDLYAPVSIGLENRKRRSDGYGSLEPQ